VIYQRQSTALHAARPGAAILWASALTLAVVACPHPAALVVLCCGLPLLARAAKVPRPVLLASAFALPFGLLWVLTNGLLVRDGLTVVLRLGGIPPFGEIDITAEALAQGAILALRGLATLQIGLLLSACVDPDRLLLGVRRIAPRAGLTGAVAMRLAPALADDGRRYADGLRCRADGGDLGGRERLLVMSATVGRAIDRADQVAAILELRGLRGSGAASAPAARAPWSRHDLALVASAIAVTAATIAASIAGLIAFEAYPTFSAADAGPAGLWAVAVIVLASAPLLARKGTEPPR
jgi:energy-coupling factor transport system permease protein